MERMPRRGGEEARPVANRMIFTSPAVRTFLASFLVLFLEIALIRWMPAYIRLLAYFSNFILLASFLGIGVGCLLRAGARARLFTFFPVLMAAVVAAVYFFRLEVSVPTAGSIYFSSGTADKVVLVESTLLLPLLFIIVAALFATLAQRMGREMAVLPPLQGYTVNIVGSLVGVVAFALISWLELPPAVWFGVAFAAAVPLVALAEPGRHGPLGAALVGLNLLFLGLSLVFVHVIARGALWSPVLQDHRRPRGSGHRRRGEQHLSPVDGAGGSQGILLSVAVRRVWRHVRERADPRRRFGHRRCRGAASTARSTSMRWRSIRRLSGSAGSSIPTGRTTIRASPSSTTTLVTSSERPPSATTWSCSRSSIR